jgi:hypothetical protein
MPRGTQHPSKKEESETVHAHYFHNIFISVNNREKHWKIIQRDEHFQKIDIRSFLPAKCTQKAFFARVFEFSV